MNQCSRPEGIYGFTGFQGFQAVVYVNDLKHWNTYPITSISKRFLNVPSDAAGIFYNFGSMRIEQKLLQMYSSLGLTKKNAKY